MQNQKLFEPFQFVKSGKTASNRIVLAPMTNMQSHEDGTLSDHEYKWLTRRAKEGFGTIITCASHVSEDGQGWKGELGIYDDKHIEGLTALAEGLHQYGSLCIVQLFHGGARCPQELIAQQPWSASAHSMTIAGKEVKVRAATLAEIERVILDFENAAVRAYTAGFDGIELHGAHGYLLHQFLSTQTNQRNDQWGGNFENRSRLLRAILWRIKQRIPANFIVGVRLSPEDKFTYHGIDFDESLALANILASEGADYIHISPWDALKKPNKYPDGPLTIVEHFSVSLGPDVPLMVAGAIWTAEDALKAIELGVDFCALGKVAIGVPDWPTRAKIANAFIDRPPYSVAQLRAADLSDTFITYMKRWQGFVASDEE